MAIDIVDLPTSSLPQGICFEDVLRSYGIYTIIYIYDYIYICVCMCIYIWNMSQSMECLVLMWGIGGLPQENHRKMPR